MAPAPRRLMSRRPTFHRYPAHLCALLLLTASTLLLSSCGNFFQCEGKADCPTTCVASSTVTCPAGGTGTGTGSATVDYAYIANSSTSANDVNGYSLGTGALTAATNSPYSFGFSPTALVVTPANTFLYAASDSTLTNGSGFLYGYAIGTGGSLSILASGNPLASENINSLAVSPNGEWLFCLDNNGLTLEEYSINTSTGIIAFAQTYGITGATNATVTPTQVTIAPSGDFVVVALGTGGAETFSFDETTGIANPETLLTPATTAIGIYSAAVDANNYLYLGGTNGLSVYSTSNIGVPTLLNTYATGNGPRAVIVNTASTYVYVGNQTDGTISGFSIGTNGALTPIAGSPFTGPSTVDAMAFDSTMKYLIASGYNTSTGIQLFTIGSNGALTSAATAATGISPIIPGAIATTH